MPCIMEAEMREKKRSWKKTAPTILILLLVLALAGLPALLERQKTSEDGRYLYSGTAARNSISVTVSGTGVLAEGEALDITVPVDVKIVEYLVSDGDYVEEGQPVARVDTISAYSAAADVTATLAAIEEDLAEVQSTAVSSSITSNVSGVLTSLYADVGDDIRQVMIEHGALAEITMDNGTVIRVSGTNGIIKESPLQTGWEVYDGAVLYRVNEVDATSEYGNLVLKHQKYETMIAQLFQMIRDGYVIAPESGMISSVDESLLQKTFSASLTEPTPSVTLSEEPGPEKERAQREDVFPGAEGMPLSAEADRENLSGNYPDTETAATASDNSPNGQMPKVDYVVSPLTDDGSSNSSTETVSSYLFGKISSAIDSNGMANVEFTDSTTGDTKTICVDFSSFENAKKGFYVCLQMDTVTTTYTDGSEPMTENSYTVLLVTEISIPNGGGSGASGKSGGSGGSGNITGGNTGSAAGGSTGGQTGGSDTGSTSEKMYSLNTAIIASIVPTDNMVISITVDELDILSITQNAEAMVVIDALPGRSFEGTVTGVNTGSSNSGGNSKYLAEITIAREDDFIAGMNASGLITLKTYDNVITVPTAALSERNGRTVVYTSADETTGELLEPAEVETGVSDGELTEVLSGLEEGDEYWYIWYETDELSDLSNTSPGSSFFGGFRSLGGRQGRGR